MILVEWTTGKNVCAIIRNSEGQIIDLNGDFLTWNPANINNYRFDLTEQSQSGHYRYDFPEGFLPEGDYYVVVYQRAGSSLTLTDVKILSDTLKIGSSGLAITGAESVRTMYIPGRIVITPLDPDDDGMATRFVNADGTEPDSLKLYAVVKADTDQVVNLTGHTVEVICNNLSGVSSATLTAVVSSAEHGIVNLDGEVPSVPGFYRIYVLISSLDLTAGPILLKVEAR
jgi:hypothetical protein